MDPLSHVLTLLRPEAVGWRVIEAHDAWTLRFPAMRDAVVFGQVMAAGCDIAREDGREVQMSAGDFILMVSPPVWSMRVLRGGPEVDLKALLANPVLLRVNKPRLVTKLIAGYFTFVVGADLFGQLMLPIVHVRAATVTASSLGTLLSLLGEEAVADRAGRSHVLERLLQLILVEALRQPGLGWDQTGRGLLHGLADPKIAKALRMMHEEVTRSWSVAELALAAGMSRSAFAARFAEIVGLPPIDYLSSWRMTLAKQALETGGRPMADIAELAGYQSVSAFSTAFRRLTGLSPTAYLRSMSHDKTPRL